MSNMNNKPEISVIMSVYNGETYLSEAIESVIAQTFRNWELIIINDCSKDATADILSKYANEDERIKVFHNEINLKLPTSLNKAISLSSGKYIARMDADDICLPERLEKQYEYMEKNEEVSLSSCRFLTVKNGVYTCGGYGARTDNNALSALLLVTNPILHPGVIARAEVMKNLLYDTTLTCTEDLELWTRMVMNNKKISILPEYLLIYRLHDKQITSTTLERQHKEVLEIQNKFFSESIGVMDEEQKEVYIHGIYFREKPDTDKFKSFFKWLKKENKIKKAFDNNMICYAMFEILAEYKRCGISGAEVIKTMLSFNPVFLAKEIIRRKKAARREILSCKKAALKKNLIQKAGTDNYPIFENRELK